MADSDFTQQGEGAFASVAVLSAEVSYLDDTFPYSVFSTANGDVRDIGEGIIIGDEICRLTELGVGYFKAKRGCADTIPQVHSIGTKAWFYETNVGTDSKEYLAEETIGIKIQPFTASNPPLALNKVPPQTLTFNWRYFRPYPPADVTVDGNPWFQTPFALGSDTSIVIDWVHRNRTTQQDVLVSHDEPNVPAEAGTTYQLEVYRDTVLKTTRSLGLVNTLTYTWLDAYDDLDLAGDPSVVTLDVVLVLYAYRDGLKSTQGYSISGTFNPESWLLIESGDDLLLEDGSRIAIDI